jgi:hypothetical protein
MLMHWEHPETTPGKPPAEANVETGRDGEIRSNAPGAG